MDSCQLVVFTLGDEEYAFHISCAKEIMRIPDLTKIPNAPYFIEGIFNLRGKVITVIDLKKRFGNDPSERGTDSRLLILDFDEMDVGIIVDDVSEVMRIDTTSIQKLNNELSKFSRNSMEGIIFKEQRLIILLNTSELKKDIFQYCSGKELEA